MTLAGIMAGLHVSGQKFRDLRLVVFGSGSAGIGIADQVRDAIATEVNISHEDASKQIWFVNNSFIEGTKLTPPGSLTNLVS